jgi:hypothetical protein
MTICDTTATGSRSPTSPARTDRSKPLIMRLSWSQHLAAARTLELTGSEQTGTALALMGMAIVMLLQDLQPMTSSESSANEQA